VSTVTGDPTIAGDVVDNNFGRDDGDRFSASFHNPQDVSAARHADGYDVLYVADTNNNLIRRVDLFAASSPQVRTLSPSPRL
jgi:hypothetical protein